ncbi:MAG: right-handed parallel beta-helix repeat-containing protein [Fibrobacteres bacterium]|nr:right-handed parallel beta-helix repeat-containing protein [Fibrobacterota bacterium]
MSRFASTAVAFLAPLVATISDASTYYLDAGSPTPTGDGRSPTTAWKTMIQLQKTTLQPGDSVLFKRGSKWTNDSLKLDSRHSGSAEAPVVVSTYGNPADSAPHLSNSGRVFGIHRGSHLVVEGLHFSGARASCIEIGDTGAHHIVIQDSEADRCGAGVDIARAREVVVRRNFLHDMKMIRNTKGDSGTAADNDDYGAMGIVLTAANGCSIYQNHLKNCRDTSYDYGFDGGAVEAWGAVKNCDIYQNLAEYTDGFMEFGGAATDTVRNVRIHHNLALESGTFSWIHVFDGSDIFGMHYDGLRIEHNTGVTRGRMVRFFFGGGGKLDDPEQISIRNNILVTDSLKGGTYYKPPYAIGSNLIWAPTNPFPTSFPAGPGDLWKDPKFVSAGDYSLQATSPARDAGMDRGYRTDYLGKSGWRGTAPDLGAFEFQEGEDHVGNLPRKALGPIQAKPRYDIRGVRAKFLRGWIDLLISK